MPENLPVPRRGVTGPTLKKTKWALNAPGLKPWMRMFASWLATEGSGLTKAKQLSTARRFARINLSGHLLKRLLDRPDFQELTLKYAEDYSAVARDRLLELLPKAIDTIDWSIDKARACGDYRAVPMVTEPVLTRTLLKREAVQAPPVQITVNLGTFAKRTIEVETQAVEVIELPLPTE